jgi:Tol biopolymer transport system component
MVPERSMMNIRRLAISFVVLFWLACTGREPLGPNRPSLGDPSSEIVDAVHNAGNPHFFFLPPMVPAPAFSGRADDLLTPTVTICQRDGGCIAEFNVTADGDHQYHVNWQTDQCYWGPCTLNPGDIYRLTVSVGSKELGHADLIVVTSQGKAKNLQTNEYIALVDGRTLPVKFRIETGIVAGLSISPNPAIVPVGASLQLTATVTDLHGSVLSNPTVSWSSTATDLATITLSGMLTGVKSGCPHVTAISEDVSASSEVRVTPLQPDLLFQDDQRVVNDGAYYIYAGRVDGCTAAYRLTSTRPTRDGVLSVSQDRQLIAFVPDRYDDLSIHVVGIDGSNERTLSTPHVRALWATWSPDGTQIALTGYFVNQFGEFVGPHEGFLMAADGTNFRQLTHLNKVSGPLRWSPAGTQLAFQRESSNRNVISVVNPDGTNLTDLTAAPRYASYPSWFQDGNRILYVDLYDASIWAVQKSTSVSEQIVSSQNQMNSALSVSPDGTQIAYEAYTCGGSSLHVAAISGGTPQTLVCLPGPNHINGDPSGVAGPAWSADGSEILYSAFVGGPFYGLYAVSKDGTSTRYLGTGIRPVVIR